MPPVLDQNENSKLGLGRKDDFDAQLASIGTFDVV